MRTDGLVQATHLVPKEITNVVNAIQYHSWSVQHKQHPSVMTLFLFAKTSCGTWSYGLGDKQAFHLSNDKPQAMTETSAGSPIGWSISGRNIPELPTSTHFLSVSW